MELEETLEIIPSSDRCENRNTESEGNWSDITQMCHMDTVVFLHSLQISFPFNILASVHNTLIMQIWMHYLMAGEILISACTIYYDHCHS